MTVIFKVLVATRSNSNDSSGDWIWKRSALFWRGFNEKEGRKKKGNKSSPHEVKTSTSFQMI